MSSHRHWDSVIHILWYIKDALGRVDIQDTKLIYDSQVALHNASNLVFYEHTKYIKIDWHVSSSNQLLNKFTKSLKGSHVY
ncbi:hypothetical protein CR513_12992, partial [Mucuna pruriens]